MSSTASPFAIYTQTDIWSVSYDGTPVVTWSNPLQVNNNPHNEVPFFAGLLQPGQAMENVDYALTDHHACTLIPDHEPVQVVPEPATCGLAFAAVLWALAWRVCFR